MPTMRKSLVAQVLVCHHFYRWPHHRALGFAPAPSLPRLAEVTTLQAQDPDAVAAAAAAVAARRAAKTEKTTWDRVMEARRSGNGTVAEALLGVDGGALAGAGVGGGVMAIESLLRFLGPYPALALSFPDLSTAAQLAKGTKGVSLDFVVDTAANTNTINQMVAEQLLLPKVGSAPGGVGAGGTIAGGTTYLLGNCELGDSPVEDRFVFMGGLTASALPLASPVAAGILGAPFLFSFKASRCVGHEPDGSGGAAAVTTTVAGAKAGREEPLRGGERRRRWRSIRRGRGRRRRCADDSFFRRPRGHRGGDVRPERGARGAAAERTHQGRGDD